MIQNIEVNKIYSNPDNPRKDLGDLTELSDSIKKNGVMQNLTVIPGHHLTKEEEDDLKAELTTLNKDDDRYWDITNILKTKMSDEGYTLLIGHRRCAAAKLAGLEMLPCMVINGMDKNEQMLTMLEENMQRNDLTVIEQAEGFQYMLDLGESQDSIAEKTGFSKKTIQHRLNVCKLDKDEVVKKTDKDGEFQLTLTDLYQLEKIKDIEKRNEVLRNATDSKDLIWKAKLAVNKEISNANLKLFVDFFKKKGIDNAPENTRQELYGDKWEVIHKFSLLDDFNEDEIEISEDKCMWLRYYNDQICIIKQKKKEKKELTKEDIERREMKKRKMELKEKNKSVINDIFKFIRAIVVDKEIKPLKHNKDFYEKLLSTVLTVKPLLYDYTICEFFTGKSLYALEKDKEAYNEYLKKLDSLSSIEKFLISFYSLESVEIFNCQLEYNKKNAERIKAAVNFLTDYGFSLTKEQQDFLNGEDEQFTIKDASEKIADTSEDILDDEAEKVSEPDKSRLAS